MRLKTMRAAATVMPTTAPVPRAVLLVEFEVSGALGGRLLEPGGTSVSEGES